MLNSDGMEFVIARYVLLCAAALLGVPAQAGEEAKTQMPAEDQAQVGQLPKIYVSADGKALYLIGPVIYGTYFDFVRTVRKSPKVKMIYLGSQGGTAVDGLLIANQVRKRGYDTHVGHYCASTCTQIFMAGTKRSADPMAQIGFHRSYLVDKQGQIVEEPDGEEKNPATLNEAMGLDGDAALRLSYSRAGLTDEFIERVLAVPGSDMWHPDMTELQSTGVLNSRDPVMDVAPPNDSVEYADILSSLDGRPFWQAMKSRFPSIFETAARQIWRMRNVGVEAEKAYWVAREPLVEAAGREVPTAPDALIDQLAMHDGKSATWEKANGYPSCAPDSVGVHIPEGEELVTIETQERLLMAVLASPEKGKPVDPAKADREFGKFWRDFERMQLIEPENPGDPQRECRAGLQIYEAIARLEPKKRIKAYRALLAYPD